MNRFWDKVDKTTTPDDCWEWKAVKLKGYGQFWFKDKMALAHRVSWELSFGPIPNGLNVLHKCDNPSCVNPAHLFLGTPKDNAQDSLKKGRRFIPDNRGEKQGRHKLTEPQVREIRRLRASGLTWENLASQFKMSTRGIRTIISGHSWSWLE